MDGDPESNYVHFCMHKFGWSPSKFFELPLREQAFVIASIDVRVEEDKKREAELKSKPKRGKKGKRRR